MGGLLILVGLAGFLFGLVNLVRPLGRLRVETRKQATLVVGASVVVMVDQPVRRCANLTHPHRHLTAFNGM